MEDSEIIAKLLPLFDAYTAPYKFQYQIWTGFLLLVRSILFLKIHHTIEIGTLMDQLPTHMCSEGRGIALFVGMFVSVTHTCI